jgi:hypothetical protein
MANLLRHRCLRTQQNGRRTDRPGRQAHDAGLTVTELYTSWLTVLPEEAVIEARVDADHETAEQLNDEVVKILDALRSNGYEPTLRIEDIEYGGGGPLPARTPPEGG